MTTFNVYRRESSDINPPVAIATGLTSMSYSDNTAESEKAYLYSVGAVKGGFEKISQESYVLAMPEYANTYLRLKEDFVDLGTNPKSIINNGVVFDSGKSIFNGSQYLQSLLKSPDFAFGSQPFTIEAIVSVKVGGGGTLIDMRDVYQNQSTITASYANLVVVNPVSMGWSNGSVLHSAAYNFTPNTEYAVSVTRDLLNKLRFFVNGHKIFETTDTTNIVNSRYIHVGITRLQNGGVEGGFKGNIRNIRITKGVAKYTSDYLITYQNK